ncbi:MAG: FKBP-type peptidyl-prolyl cis-trans isomerase [Gammaproteobacteria bacterium]|nr:MAG: FKBP-type peptidyl-prolyl cis-trans isomerase [Gammaproteobacteria bacterium]
MSSKFDTVEQQVSYGIGRQMGDQLKQSPFKDLQLDAFVGGITDALEGNPAQVENSVVKAAFEEVNKRIDASKAGDKDKFAADGEKFLAENAQREEITVTESGLQYEVLTAGSGATPSASSKVSTHYEGKLIDGKVFDSSYQRGQPADFLVNGVIAGWTEALQMMEEGSKWRLYVPYHLAYGEKGAGGLIGPYAALIFDVELISVLS